MYIIYLNRTEQGQTVHKTAIDRKQMQTERRTDNRVIGQNAKRWQRTDLQTQHTEGKQMLAIFALHVTYSRSDPRRAVLMAGSLCWTPGWGS